MPSRSSDNRTNMREGLMFKTDVKIDVYDLFLVFVVFVGFLYFDDICWFMYHIFNLNDVQFK